MKTQIDEVEIVPIKPREGLIAFASCVVDKKLYLGNIGVHSKLDGSGYRLTYPTKKLGLSNIPIYHPINKQLGEAIAKAIGEKVDKLMGGVEGEGP